MKPSWNDAPEWAQWLAMNDDGGWRWLENEPELCAGMWFAKGKSQYISTQLEPIKEPRP